MINYEGKIRFLIIDNFPIDNFLPIASSKKRSFHHNSA
jgi:hypothetical protein